MDLKVQVIVYRLVYILVGFFASYVETIFRGWLKLEFKGDILAGTHEEHFSKHKDASDDAQVVQEMKIVGNKDSKQVIHFLYSHIPGDKLNAAYHDPKLNQHINMITSSHLKVPIIIPTKDFKKGIQLKLDHD